MNTGDVTKLVPPQTDHFKTFHAVRDEMMSKKSKRPRSDSDDDDSDRRRGTPYGYAPYMMPPPPGYPPPYFGFFPPSYPHAPAASTPPSSRRAPLATAPADAAPSSDPPDVMQASSYPTFERFLNDLSKIEANKPRKLDELIFVFASADFYHIDEIKNKSPSDLVKELTSGISFGNASFVLDKVRDMIKFIDKEKARAAHT